MSDSIDVKSRWLQICRSAKSHAASTAANCRKEAAALIKQQAVKFCEREPPETEAELSKRQKEVVFLTSRISSVSHSDLMARSHSSVANEIMAETKLFLDRLDLDEPPGKASMELISKISELCYSDFMQTS